MLGDFFKECLYLLVLQYMEALKGNFRKEFLPIFQVFFYVIVTL